MRPREPLPSPEQPDMCWRSEVEAPNLSRVGLCCGKESGFRRISFFFVRVIIFFPFLLNPKSMSASCKLNGGRCLDGAPSEAKLLPQSNPGKAKPGLTGHREPVPAPKRHPAPRTLRKPPSSARAAPAPCVLGCRGSPRRSRRERRGRRTAAKRGNLVNGNKGRVFSSAQPLELMFPPLE